MLHISNETPPAIEQRLLKVIAAANITACEGIFAFEETAVSAGAPPLDGGTLALVRDDSVWSRLHRVGDQHAGETFGIVRFHFPRHLDNSGFVGWLATKLKYELGTGVFVVCGQNSSEGGIFDYLGFPASLNPAVLDQISALRRAGQALTEK